jgi:hypothetical protein
MRVVKLVLGILLAVALVISSARRIPEIIENSGDSTYALSYMFSTIGFTLLLAALSAWLIISGLKRKVSASSSDREEQ